jgi:hypothetical protein
MDSNNLSSSLRSFRSSPLVDGPGIDDLINTPATSHHSSHQSIVTAGGTEHELNSNTLRDIEGYTRAFIAALQDYLDHFHHGASQAVEANPALGLPLTTTTRLLSATMMISRLKHLTSSGVKDPVKDIIRSVQEFSTSDLPTWAALPVEGLTYDVPARAVKEVESLRNEILNIWSLTTRNGAMVSPSAFTKRRVWAEMQKREKALLCHRPASKRPHLPLEVMHAAFFEFVEKAELGDDKLAERTEFHAAAEALCEHLTAPLESETQRASLILQELRKIFPENTCFRWRMEKHVDKGRIDLIYQKILKSEYHTRFPQQPKVDYVTNLIIIEVKLEEGENGDAFMQVARYYGNIVEGNPRYHESGAPMFLITISGMFIFDMCICLLTIFF